MGTHSSLAIGSGLTMADWAVTLSEAGYRGTLHVLSRRGVWPKAHGPAAPVDFGIATVTLPRTVGTWLRQIRDYIRSHGCDWRSAIDAPCGQPLRTFGRALTLAAQRRFLRHLRPYWDCHRHRLAPAVGERREVLAASGQLVRHVGRILGYQGSERDVEVRIKRRGLE